MNNRTNETVKTINAADLFCGAGGITNGLKDAAQDLGWMVDLVAINHWEIAVATHSKNHPEVRHLCASIEHVDPREVVPGGRLDILVAGPQCTFFSRARGGRPVSDQQRISPWLVLDWLEKLDVRNVLIENVPELMKWGPVDPVTGKPIKKMEGKTFVAYIQAIKSLGYNVQYRVINCADYGDATTRERLFVMARKGRRVRWPEPTHADPKKAGAQLHLFEQVKPWCPAREIIDWSKPGTSIYGRKRPLSENTLRRIEAGLRKFSGLPFVLGQQSQAAPRSVDDPIPTVAGAGAISLVQPFLVMLNGTSSEHVNRSVRSVDEPVPTVVGSPHLCLAQPLVVDVGKLAQPFTITAGGHDDQPTGADLASMIRPFLVETIHGKDWSRVYSIDEPMKTVTSVDAWGLAQPYLVQYNGTADARSIDEPLPTATTRDRFGLAQPIFFKIAGDSALYMLDILFRMLMPKELAAAMSFPRTYMFVGKREDVVKQIGNAVPRRTAKALCRSLLE